MELNVVEFQNAEDAAANLNYKDHGKYYTCTCPACEQSEGFLYKESPNFIKCNRQNECGVTTRIHFTDHVENTYIPKNVQAKKEVDYADPEYLKELKTFSELTKQNFSIYDDDLIKQYEENIDNQAFYERREQLAEALTSYAEQRKLPVDVLKGNIDVNTGIEHLKEQYPKLFETYHKYAFKNRNVMYLTFNEYGLAERLYLRSTDPTISPKERQFKLLDGSNNFFKNLNSKYIFFTEGYLDALAIKAMNEDIGYIAIPGSQQYKNALNWITDNKHLFHDKTIILAVDQDNAGHELSKKLVDTFEELQIAHTTMNLGIHKDPNDFLRADQHGFLAAIDQSQRRADIRKELIHTAPAEYNIKEIGEVLRKNTLNVLQDDKLFNEYLNFCAQFPRYSARNQMMLYTQNPFLGVTASMSQLKQHGIYVNKGEKAYRIVTPTNMVLYNVDGKLKTYNHLTESEKKQSKSFEKIEKKTYRIKACVYDISQTNARETGKLPELLKQLEGEMKPNEVELFEAMKQTFAEGGIPVHVRDTHSVGGYYQNTSGADEITLNTRNTDRQQIRVALHEYSHYILHHDKNRGSITSEQAEIEAESAAAITAKYFGLDTFEHSAVYVATWARANPDLLKDTKILARINSLSQVMIKKIDAKLITMRQSKNHNLHHNQEEHTPLNQQRKNEEIFDSSMTLSPDISF